jgi:hypothetical protein
MIKGAKIFRGKNKGIPRITTANKTNHANKAEK